MTVLADGYVRVSGILAFENLYAADKKGKFGGKFLIPKTSTQEIAELTQLQQNAANSSGKPYIAKFTPGNQDYDGDVYCDSKGTRVTSFAGYWILNARSGFPIVLLDEQNGELNPTAIPAHKQKIYSGVGVDFVVNAFGYEGKDGGKPGVAFGLAAVKITDATKPRISEGGSGGLNAQSAAALFGGSPAPAPAPTAAAPAPAPAPQNDFLAPPPVKKLVQTGQHTIEALRAANWSDEQMVSAGHAAWQ
ncbi:MAG: protein of unknown function DUF2815 [Siphoviridae sp. ctdc_1]|nr:MAG: protein of unknown function DUF2815 [Siphoviridae sp. ctdc_1]